MAGTAAGARKAVATIRQRNPNFYSEIGAKGGSNGTTGGFAYAGLCECDFEEEPHKKARCANAKSVRVRRSKSKRG